VWGGWLSKKPFQKELAMHRLTFDPRQRRVLLLVVHKVTYTMGVLYFLHWNVEFYSHAFLSVLLPW
jgi:hypothetical protein